MGGLLLGLIARFSGDLYRPHIPDQTKIGVGTVIKEGPKEILRAVGVLCLKGEEQLCDMNPKWRCRKLE
ncbi:hypothetical protein GYMLUDRAFT_43118 [Collybiopsis luxurians FD-317 M1]|uniref:Uncharacterized protein n=1 Tax=Collybiopsis luxurians FD-317 M1 TaxID=944289 RepID=A0A0D0BBC7_9AGAR|nr:hypothetical protein GYMLUDRAFT_43118 [Collybiopsis luxurians FD-317 M1]